MSAAISGTPNPLQSVASRNGLQEVHHLTAGAREVQLRSHPMARTAKTATDSTDKTGLDRRDCNGQHGHDENTGVSEKVSQASLHVRVVLSVVVPYFVWS